MQGFAPSALAVIASSAAISCYALLLIMARLLPGNFSRIQRSAATNQVRTTRQLGGIALAPVAMLAPMYAWYPAGYPIALLVALTGIFVLGLVDDIKSLSALLKLVLQFIICALLFVYLADLAAPVSRPLFQIPGLLALVTIITMTYGVNACNFMDGLDLMLVAGLAAPLILLSGFLILSGEGHLLALVAFACGFALVGFALHNLPPARLILGDSGSLFIGLVTSGTVFLVWQHTSIWVALVPVSYFLIDTLSTLLLRIRDGENIFRAHSRHAYQMARSRGVSVGTIIAGVFMITLVNCVISLRLAQTDGVHPVLGFACFLPSTALVWWLRYGADAIPDARQE